MQKRKTRTPYQLGRIFVLFLLMATLFNCGSSSETETIEVPTQGLITTVAEVSKDDFKIEDESPVANVDDSRIIAKYMSGQADTFTLDEAKLIQTTAPDTSRRHRSVRAGGMGFWFFLMAGRMGGHTPNSSAYVNQNAYNRANSTAGTAMKNTARSTSRAKKGYGSGKSSRSYGG